MSMRGIYGFKRNNKYKVTYEHSYSNPDRLGLNILKFCADTSIEEMNEIYNKIILVTEDDAKN